MLDISTIVERIADGLVAIDAMALRSKPKYLRGLPSMLEPDVCAELRDWWHETYPKDFNPPGAIGIQRAYPRPKKSRRGPLCDLVLSTDGTWPDPEWAIEVKRIQLVGDNGKNNDFGLPKVISPYLKDRSLVHDAIRLRTSGLSKRCAVVGYGFEYDQSSLAAAMQFHKGARQRAAISALQSVCTKNDPTNLNYGLLPLIDVVNVLLAQQCLPKSSVHTIRNNVWTHPCGGRLRVFAWEI